MIMLGCCNKLSSPTKSGHKKRRDATVKDERNKSCCRIVQGDDADIELIPMASKGIVLSKPTHCRKGFYDTTKRRQGAVSDAITSVCKKKKKARMSSPSSSSSTTKSKTNRDSKSHSNEQRSLSSATSNSRQGPIISARGRSISSSSSSGTLKPSPSSNRQSASSSRNHPRNTEPMRQTTNHTKSTTSSSSSSHDDTVAATAACAAAVVIARSHRSGSSRDIPPPAKSISVSRSMKASRSSKMADIFNSDSSTVSANPKLNTKRGSVDYLDGQLVSMVRLARSYDSSLNSTKAKGAVKFSGADFNQVISSGNYRRILPESGTFGQSNFFPQIAIQLSLRNNLVYCNLQLYRRMKEKLGDGTYLLQLSQDRVPELCDRFLYHNGHFLKVTTQLFFANMDYNKDKSIQFRVNMKDVTNELR